MKTAPVLCAAVTLLAMAAQPVSADPGYRHGYGHWGGGEAHYRNRGFRDCDDGYRRGVERHYYYQRYEGRPVYYSRPSYHYYHYDRDDYHHDHHHGHDHDLDLLAIIGGAILVDQVLDR